MTMYLFDENDEFFRYPSGAVKAPGTLRLRIKLRRGSNAESVSVYCRNDNGSARDITMEFSGAAGSYDIFECEAALDKPGLYWYNFIIRSYGGQIATLPEQMGGAFQITVFSQDSKTPEWIRGGLVYHIFVDRFCRGGELRLAPAAVFREDWGGCPYFLPDENGIVKNNDFFGGDLYGIIYKLPYLESLGVTCIYLSPVFEAASNHKYDTGDFMKIDDAFGGDEAFSKLCRAASERGIRVILDGVFNHVGIDSVYFNKYGKYAGCGAYEGDASPYRDWFMFRGDGTYDAWWGIELLPTLNKNSAEYRDYICGENGVIARWEKAGVSGWRLDVVDELPDVFLDPLCAAIKRSGGDALIIGEVWEDASNKIAYGVRRRYFQGGQLDGVLNYPVCNAVIACVRDANPEVLADTVTAQCRNYPESVLHSVFNVLGTHDTVRILTVLSGRLLPYDKSEMADFRLDAGSLALAKKRLRLASLLQFTLPGVPCVYYGDEAGMEGGADPFNRRCYPWGNEDKDLLEWYARLSELRRGHGCFKDGRYKTVQARDGVFAFTRGEGNGQVLVAVNTSANDAEVKTRGFNYNLLTGGYVDTLAVKAGGAAVFTFYERG